MKKSIKKVLILLLSMTMAFTMMAMPVYADGEDIIPSEAVDAVDGQEMTDVVDDQETADVVDSQETTDVVAEESTAGEDLTVEEDPAITGEAAPNAEPAPAVQEEEPEVVLKNSEPTRGDGDEPSALDLVIAAIETLPYDPTEFTAADLERVEAINADFEALSAEDQEIIDNKTGHPNGDTQSYGRVLEASLWAVRSFNTDQSTMLADGTYTTSTEPAVSSVSNKGKSDSSRVRNWWVESVTVENGQATAYIYVTSGAATANKLTSYPSVWVGGKTIERNSDNNYPIPVDLNGKTYFGGISSSMPRPIMYELTTTINEPTALDLVIAAIETLPYDPTEFTAADLERVEAINADFEALSAEDQEIIDNKTGHPNGDTQSYGRVLEASLWAVRSFNTDQSTTLADGTYTTSTEPAVSSVSNKGKSDSSRVRNWWVESVTVENGQATAYIYVTSGAATANKLTSYPSVWVGGKAIERNSDNNYPIPVDLNGKTYFGGISSSMPRPIMYELTTTIEEPVPLTVDKTQAGMMKPADKSYLKDDNTLILCMENDSFNAAFVGDGRTLVESEVIALASDNTFTFTVPELETEFMAAFKSKKNGTWYNKRITVSRSEAKLTVIDDKADYTAVDTALANVPSDLSIYTDETAQAVDDAVAAVGKRNLNSVEQAKVDAMATAIEEAVAGLVLKTDISGAEIEAIPAQTYSGKALTPDVTVKLGEETLIKDTDYTVSFKNNTNVGTANVTVTGKGNYGGTVTATFKINVKKITPKVTLSKTSFTYNGKAQQPAVLAVYDGSTKLPASQYTAKVTAGKNIGTYNVTVTLKGNYSGSKTVNYQIVPKGATIKAPKKAKKAMTVKWKAQKSKMPKARIAGYQIQYATDKAFTKNVKSVTVKGYKKTSKKIKKLNAKTTYYVRVRTYMKVSGKTYYSTWSAVKSVKTK